MIKKFTQYILEAKYGNDSNLFDLEDKLSKIKIYPKVGLNSLDQIIPNFACLIIILDDDSVIDYQDCDDIVKYNSIDEMIQKVYIGDVDDESLLDYYRGVFTNEETIDGDVLYIDVTQNSMYREFLENKDISVLRIYEVRDGDPHNKGYGIEPIKVKKISR